MLLKLFELLPKRDVAPQGPGSRILFFLVKVKFHKKKMLLTLYDFFFNRSILWIIHKIDLFHPLFYEFAQTKCWANLLGRAEKGALYSHGSRGQERSGKVRIWVSIVRKNGQCSESQENRTWSQEKAGFCHQAWKMWKLIITLFSK